MKIIRHSGNYWVGKTQSFSPRLLADLSGLPTTDFWTLTKTETEHSVVSPFQHHQDYLQVEGPWTLFQVEGQLDFSLTGILSSLAAPLADAKISIFAISSYDTDFIMTAASDANRTAEIWRQNGFVVS